MSFKSFVFFFSPYTINCFKCLSHYGLMGYGWNILFEVVVVAKSALKRNKRKRNENKTKKLWSLVIIMIIKIIKMKFNIHLMCHKTMMLYCSILYCCMYIVHWLEYSQPAGQAVNQTTKWKQPTTTSAKSFKYLWCLSVCLDVVGI